MLLNDRRKDASNWSYLSFPHSTNMTRVGIVHDEVTLTFGHEDLDPVNVQLLQCFFQLALRSHEVRALVGAELLYRTAYGNKTAKCIDEHISTHSSRASKWKARELMHMNRRPYILSCFLPALTRNRPKQSIPLNVNGGEGSTLSCRRLAIFCSLTRLLILLHLTHRWMWAATALLQPIIQRPFDRILLIVMALP